MRLLNTETLKLEEFHHGRVPQYAALSHRWGDSEITFAAITSGGLNPDLAGHAKIQACCKLALSRGTSYVWIDTCCIDKSSSAELTESINSMYKWYQRASECYAYLHDVESVGDAKPLRSSVWFQRSWTLQELIAPSDVLFFNRDWEQLGSKLSLIDDIVAATGIDPTVLNGTRSPFTFSIAQRMSWAARRKATRPEDEAYSLLGLFGIHMPMLYGEEQRAFQRLQEEIIRQSDDQTILAWSDDRPEKPPLAPSASCFRQMGQLQCIYPTNDTRLGYNLGNAGLSIHLMLIPWDMNTYFVPLSCGTGSTINRSSVRGYMRTVILLRQTEYDDHFVRVLMPLYSLMPFPNEKYSHGSSPPSDLSSFDADYIANRRDALGILPRKVFISLNTDMAVKPLAYGFHFQFGYPSMFKGGSSPAENDVWESHGWEPGRHVGFAIQRGSRRTAGTLRLSNMRVDATKIPYMHFGFNLDFAPVCLITTEVPSGREVAPDNDTSWKEGKPRGLEWLLATVQKGNTSDTTILAFTGHRTRSADIWCAKLSLKITFKIKFALDLGRDIWEVSFEQGPPPGDLTVATKTASINFSSKSDAAICLDQPGSLPGEPLLKQRATLGPPSAAVAPRLLTRRFSTALLGLGLQKAEASSEADNRLPLPWARDQRRRNKSKGTAEEETSRRAKRETDRTRREAETKTTRRTFQISLPFGVKQGAVTDFLPGKATAEASQSGGEPWRESPDVSVSFDTPRPTMVVLPL